MVNAGDIVYFDKLVFKDRQVDNKSQRPCIVLVAEEETSQVICVPLTSQIKSFNKHNYKYCLIPTVIYNYYKMNFAALENLMIRDYADVHDTGMTIDNETVNRIINKICNAEHLCDEETIERLKANQDKIKEAERQVKKEQKQLRKQMRKARKQMKSE